MTDYALIAGGIASGVVDASGWTFDAARSFKTRAGQCPMQYEHGQDNDFMGIDPARWTAYDNELFISHRLHLGHDAEFQLYQMILRGELFFSYGYGDTPTATRAAFKWAATMNARANVRAVPVPGTVSKTPIEHISYVKRPSNPQGPVQVIICY